jgi:hypothetical protein
MHAPMGLFKMIIIRVIYDVDDDVWPTGERSGLTPLARASRPVLRPRAVAMLPLSCYVMVLS